MMIFNNCYHADDQKRHRRRLESRSKSKIFHTQLEGLHIHFFGHIQALGIRSAREIEGQKRRDLKYFENMLGSADNVSKFSFMRNL